MFLTSSQMRLTALARGPCVRTTDAVQPPGLVGSETDPENRSTLSKSPSGGAQRSYQNPHLQTDCQLGALSQATRPPGRRPLAALLGKAQEKAFGGQCGSGRRGNCPLACGGHVPCIAVATQPVCLAHCLELALLPAWLLRRPSAALAAARMGGRASRASSSERWQSGQWRSISQGGLCLDLACSSPLPSG